MSARIIVGHVLDRLADLPAESVHCCVTSPPSNADRIQCLCLAVGGFHRGSKFSRSCAGADMSSAECDLSRFAPLLDNAECEAILCLQPLYAEIRQKSAQAFDGLHVSCRPGMERLAACDAWFGDVKRSAEPIAQERWDLWPDLPQCNAFAEHWSARVTADPHRIGAALNSDRPVAINCTGEVSQQFCVCHPAILAERRPR